MVTGIFVLGRLFQSGDYPCGQDPVIVALDVHNGVCPATHTALLTLCLDNRWCGVFLTIAVVAGWGNRTGWLFLCWIATDGAAKAATSRSV